MKNLLTILFVIAFSLAKSQMVSGYITNSHSEKIPFVSVYIENSTIGTIANTEGYYRLQLKKGNFTIKYSSVGYKTLTKKITINSDTILNIVLEMDVQNIDVVEIDVNNNPANDIMRKVIDNRKKYRSNPEKYSCDVYIKASLEKEKENPFAVEKEKMNFIESYSKLYVELPNNIKEEKIAYKDLSEKEDESKVDLRFLGGQGGGRRRLKRMKATDPNLFYVNVSDANFNFYENTLNIKKLGETPFISPAGNLAFASYNFKLEESFYENEELIYKIKVTPKRSKDALFSGYLYIRKNSWNIKSLELKIDGRNLHFFKSFEVYQNYDLISDSTWALKRQEFYYTLNKGFDKLHGNVYATYSNYNIVSDFERGTFSNAVRIFKVDAYEKTTTYWDSIRTIPLKEKEKLFVHKIDSITEYEKSPEYLAKQDSINNRITLTDVVLTGIDKYYRKKRFKFIIDPLIKQMGFFGVGGYRHHLGATFIKTSKKDNELELHPQIDYGFLNNDFRGSMRASYTYAPKKFAQLRVGAGSKYEMLTYFQPITALFGRSNFVLNNFLELGHDFEVVNGLFLDVFGKFMERKSIADMKLAGWIKIFGEENNKPLDFEDYNEFYLRVRLSYTPFQKYAIEPYKKVIIGSKWPKFYVQWKQGIPNIFNSKTNYQFVKLGFDKSFKLSVFGTGKISGNAGKYIHANSVEIPNYIYFRGTDNYIFSHPMFTFQLLGITHTSLSQYFEFHYMHHFNGAIVKKIPLLNRLKLESAAGGGILMIEEENFNHAEIFAGLELPFKFYNTKMKLGVYHSIAYSNYDNKANNMIKIGLNFFNPFSSEWVY